MVTIPFLNRSKKPPAAAPKKNEPVRITMLGPPGCGKSSLLVNLRHVLSAGANRAGFRVAFFFNSLAQLPIDFERPGDQVMTKPMTGVIGRGRAKYLVEISDTVGGMLLTEDEVDVSQPMEQWPELFRRTLHSDLLVILLDPRTVCDEKALQDVRTLVVQHVSHLVKLKPNAMIALVFTKADEYGIAGATRFRLADTPARRDAFRKWREDPSDDRAQFVAALNTPPDEAAGAIEVIMRRAGNMVRDLVQVADASPVNAYFVSALPIEPSVVPYPVDRRGIVEIFADFYTHTRSRRPQPTIPLWLSGGLFALATLQWPPLFIVALVVLAVIGGIRFFSRSRAR